MRVGFVPFVAAAVCALVPRVATADTNDLVLSRLAVAQPSGTFVPQNLEFRELASQLGVVLAPRMLTPADTIGFGGFQFTVDVAQTGIDNGASYWRVREGVDPGATGAVGSNSMQTVSFFVRKGLWFPAPSVELGVGGEHLVDSKIWAAQFYAKVGLVEGYHQLPIPSVSVRGGVSRMMNERQLDLTVVSLDALLSKHIGIGGTWRLEPFAGWDVLLIVPRSEVIDPTPQTDPLTMGNENDAKNNFVFKDQQTIVRQRLILGSKFRFHVLELTAELVYALAGSSVDNRVGTQDPCTLMATTTACDAKDAAKAQTTFSLSAGLEF